MGVVEDAARGRPSERVEMDGEQGTDESRCQVSTAGNKGRERGEEEAWRWERKQRHNAAWRVEQRDGEGEKDGETEIVGG